MAKVTGVAVPDHPWLLPGALNVDPDAGRGHPRRSTRDWLVDTVCFLLAIGWALFAAGDAQRPAPVLGIGNNGPDWLLEVDLLVGLAAAGALWFRRRWPVQLSVAGLIVGTFSLTAVVGLVVLMLTVIVHRPLVVSGPLTVAGVGTGVVFDMVRPDPSM